MANHVVEEWDDLVYDIARGKMDKVKSEVIMNQGFHTLALLTEGGDQILHSARNMDELSCLNGL